MNRTAITYKELMEKYYDKYFVFEQMQIEMQEGKSTKEKQIVLHWVMYMTKRLSNVAE